MQESRGSDHNLCQVAVGGLCNMAWTCTVATTS